MQDFNCLRKMLDRGIPESPIYDDCTPPDIDMRGGEVPSVELF